MPAVMHYPLLGEMASSDLWRCVAPVPWRRPVRSPDPGPCRRSSTSRLEVQSATDNPLRRKGEWNFYVASDRYGFVEIGHLSICHAVLDFLCGLPAPVRPR